MNKVIIVGGGAAGMMAAISASKEGKKVCILEKNEKLGKKLFITGKGRCNITNACPADEFLTHVVTNPRFLYSTFSQFNNEDMMDYLEEIGLPIKTERGQRVFPQSDRSSDVIDALKKQCKKGGVQIYYHTEVKELLFDEEKENCVGVLLSDGKKMMGDSVILACGGSPIMADEPDEVQDITAICGGLNINIGTLNKRTVEAMHLAGAKANELGHAVLLDPVGVGASRLRTDTAVSLVENIKFDVIRGNISEIKGLAAGGGTTKGVDADVADTVTDENLDGAIEFVNGFSKETGAIIAVTGAIDLVSNGEKCFVIRNGKPEMSKITGTGCQLSGMMTAFITANPDSKFEAAAAAVCTMGSAGDLALGKMLPGDGNATYRNRIIDTIYNMTGDILDIAAKYEIK